MGLCQHANQADGSQHCAVKANRVVRVILSDSGLCATHWSGLGLGLLPLALMLKASAESEGRTPVLLE